MLETVRLAKGKHSKMKIGKRKVPTSGRGNTSMYKQMHTWEPAMYIGMHASCAI